MLGTGSSGSIGSTECRICINLSSVSGRHACTRLKQRQREYEIRQTLPEYEEDGGARRVPEHDGREAAPVLAQSVGPERPEGVRRVLEARVVLSRLQERLHALERRRHRGLHHSRQKTYRIENAPIHVDYAFDNMLINQSKSKETLRNIE